jgi:hypothetical protein
MLRTRGQRETVTEGGWAELPEELVAKVLEVLQAAGRLRVFEDLRHGAVGVRWVEGRARCAGEAADAEMVDHRRRGGHAGAELPGGGGEPPLTDEVVRAVSSLTALTTLNLWGSNVNNEGLQTLSTLAALTPPLDEKQRVGRGEAGAAHRHPQPDDS